MNHRKEIDLTLFPNVYRVTVRFNEVDMLGVCNNAVYISFFEDARLQYIKAAGLMPEGGVFSDGKLFFMVRNEINYRNHAFYDEELSVYTRVSYVRKSSYGFEHVIVKQDGSVVVDGSGVIAHVDPVTRKSTPLDEDFICRLQQYDKNVQRL